MDKKSYTAHLEPDEDGGYTVTVPALPGCITWGADVPHATAMARECIEGFLEAIAKAGKQPPSDKSTSSIDVVIEVNLPTAV